MIRRLAMKKTVSVLAVSLFIQLIATAASASQMPINCASVEASPLCTYGRACCERQRLVAGSEGIKPCNDGLFSPVECVRKVPKGPAEPSVVAKPSKSLKFGVPPISR
jgi:hypothetical protein